MQQERDPLNLGSLPPVSSPEDNWPAIQAALEANRIGRHSRRVAGGTLAAIAILAVVIGVLLNQAPVLTENAPELSQSASGAINRPMPDAAESGEIVASLISLSQRLETSLRHIRSEVGVMPTASLIYQVELEDLVAQVDEELSMNPASTTLWSQRVNLLLDLTQLYKNELRRESHRMASL